MNRTFTLIVGFLILFASEILRVYLIMPFPGSQQSNSIKFAYALDQNIWWIRLVGLALIAYPLYKAFKSGKRPRIVGLSIVLILYIGIFWLFNFKFLAEKMFYQPTNKSMVKNEGSTIPVGKLVIGVALNGDARAYPIEIIAYHHQVRDTVGGVPVMVTYCSVCRTGRVYSPELNGKLEDFRLVGMDHFNAMFEDLTTKSWWMQATGQAVAGPLTGTSLKEIPSEQMRLSSWLKKYPASLIMQKDTLFAKSYKQLAGYDQGTIPDELEKRDTKSWQNKSWVVGVKIDNLRRAYDWNNLLSAGIIEDTLNGQPILVYVEGDNVTFHAWKRNPDGQVLNFEKDSTGMNLKDVQTHSLWTSQGDCIDGALKGKSLEKIPAYQEFWHSWRQFQPGTSAFAVDSTKK